MFVSKVSYDDVCHQSSVIERVKVTKLPDGTFQLGPQDVREIRRLLREALRSETGVVLSEGTKSLMSYFGIFREI